MPATEAKTLPCVHVWTPDPWEQKTTRCLYCNVLFEDAMPLKLPEKAPERPRLNSALVRTLRNMRARTPVRPPWHRLR